MRGVFRDRSLATPSARATSVTPEFHRQAITGGILQAAWSAAQRQSVQSLLVVTKTCLCSVPILDFGSGLILLPCAQVSVLLAGNATCLFTCLSSCLPCMLDNTLCHFIPLDSPTDIFRLRAPRPGTNSKPTGLLCFLVI